jgi:DNA-directed RNA polymerase alpha subunit
LNRFDRGDPEADAAASPPACRVGVEGEGEMSEQHILDPTPELPDDTPIENVQLPTRIRNVLADAGLNTVGEVRETTDKTFLSFQGLGPDSVAHLRKTLGLPSRDGVRPR